MLNPLASELAEYDQWDLAISTFTKKNQKKKKNEIKVQQSLLPVSLFEPFTFYLRHFVTAGLRHTNREN